MSSFLRKRAEMDLYNALYGSLWGIGDLESICELVSHRPSLRCWHNYSIVTKEWLKHKKKVKIFFAISPIWTELCLRAVATIMRSQPCRKHHVSQFICVIVSTLFLSANNSGTANYILASLHREGIGAAPGQRRGGIGEIPARHHRLSIGFA